MSHRPTCPDCGVILPCTRYEHRKGCSWIPAIPDPRDGQISALQQEIARLTTARNHDCSKAEQRIDTLKRENAALLKDKARLDWLEQRGRMSTRAMFGQDGGFTVGDDGEVLAGTIDAGYEFAQLRKAIDVAREALDEVKEQVGK